MKDYNVQVKVRNGHLLEMMRSRGLKTVADLHRASGINMLTIYNFLNLKRSAMYWRKDELVFRRAVLALAKFFRCEPEQLFPLQHLETPLRTNRAEVEMNLAEVGQITARSPEDLMIESEGHRILDDVLATLTDRERQIIRARFGFDGPPKTLAEVGSLFRNQWGGAISAERIRTVEAKAIRKMRHPKHAQRLVHLLEN